MAQPDSAPVADARRRILDAAVDVIDTDGEAALRITDIAERAGVAAGLINHHFGSRDGLVAAAQERRYNRAIFEDLDRFRDHFAPSQSREQTVAALRVAITSIADRDRAPSRMVRITSLAAAHGRPDLTVDLGEAVADSIDRATDIVEIGQELGYVRPDVDARATATVLLCLGTGYVIADFDARPATEDDSVLVIGKILDSLFLPAT
jgi:AcrR family transcriptional regulator